MGDEAMGYGLWAKRKILRSSYLHSLWPIAHVPFCYSPNSVEGTDGIGHGPDKFGIAHNLGHIPFEFEAALDHPFDVVFLDHRFEVAGRADNKKPWIFGSGIFK